jgi:DNA mismatch repair protein MutS
MNTALGPPEKMRERRAELTPMMTQYFELCDRYDDALVLFQVGDFYEAFCGAAETVARRCEITLTQREDSTGTYAMAGIPIDNAESYVDRLLEAGYQVAVADQVEDPEETTGVVDRAVTRVLTPGTLTENELLDTERNNYVAAVAADGSLGLAVLDVSTGEFYATSTNTRAELADELGRFDPAEVVVGPDAPADALPEGVVRTTHEQATFALGAARDRLNEYVGDPDRLLGGTCELRACGALLSYAEYARGGEQTRLDYINHLTRYDPHEYMLLDAVAIDSLELFEPRAVHGREGGTLVAVVDETASALGRRTLDAWLRRPLLDADRIAARHDAVGELRERVQVRERVHDQLREVYDIERLISRVARTRANARDLRSLADSLSVVPELRDALADTDCEPLAALREALDPLPEVRSLIETAIVSDPPQELTEGGVVRPAYDEELAGLRETERDGKAWVEDLEVRERERTGIDSLKVGYNSVHGYYIEVTDANLDRVPDDYERRQTLKNAERYYTPALKKREDEIIRAEQRADELEYDLFCEVRSDVAEASERVQALADALGELDVLVGFATVAAEHDYTRPSVGVDPGRNGDAGGIRIEGGRHPVVERTEEAFVPNDTRLGPAERLAVVTGPNMSGKSTYMRQVALTAILAQAGSFVPADAARMQVFDRVFTRVGASDDIAGGRSTFLVEMDELSTILDSATERSLVLLDEVGRGTSTADGFAIARAVTEHLHDEVGALTLFATHHHDLTAVAADLDGAYNLYFRTERTDAGVVFEHDVERGTADASYGVEVAATAGIDEAVVDRARELLDRSSTRGLDRSSTRGLDQTGTDTEETGAGETATPGTEIGAPKQMTNTDSDSQTASHQVERTDTNAGEETDIDAELLRRRFSEVDVATMTPLEALNTLAELKRWAESER